MEADIQNTPKKKSATSDSTLMKSTDTCDLTAKSVQTIRPHIESCVKYLTPDQWRLVELGSSDSNTKHRVAHMLLNILSNVSGVWSKKMKEGVSIERLRDSLNESFACSFAEVLAVESVPAPSTDKLVELIATEIGHYVQAPVAKARVTPPCKLNAMICSVCKILKTCGGKMKKFYSSVTQSQSRKGAVSSDQSAQSVQDIITDKAAQIIEPILDNVADTEYQLLEEVSSLENQCAADDIAQSVSEVMCFQEKPDPDVDPQEQKHKLLGRVKIKICDFFTKSFIKASMCQIVSQVKARFTRQVKLADSESLRFLLAGVESVLLTGGKVGSDGGRVCGLHRLREISPRKALAITGKLSPLLYGHITGDDNSVCAASGARPRDGIYRDIQSRVICFLSLVSWWLNNQAPLCSNNALMALTDTDAAATSHLREITTEEFEEKAAPATVGVNPQLDAAALKGNNRFFLRTVITNLFLNAVTKVEQSLVVVPDLESKIDSLVDEIWSELESTTVAITTRDVDRLRKSIIKALRKSCCSLMGLLVSMESGHSAGLQILITTCFKTHLDKKCHGTSRAASILRWKK